MPWGWDQNIREREYLSRPLLQFDQAWDTAKRRTAAKQFTAPACVQPPDHTVIWFWRIAGSCSVLTGTVGGAVFGNWPLILLGAIGLAITVPAMRSRS